MMGSLGTHESFLEGGAPAEKSASHVLSGIAARLPARPVRRRLVDL
jgi:hypothetical protein